MDRLLTVQEAARLLGVSTKTLRRWDQAGKFIAQRTVGNQRRYTSRQIAEFLNSGHIINPEIASISAEEAVTNSSSQPNKDPQSHTSAKDQTIPSAFKETTKSVSLNHLTIGFLLSVAASSALISSVNSQLSGKNSVTRSPAILSDKSNKESDLNTDLTSSVMSTLDSSVVSMLGQVNKNLGYITHEDRVALASKQEGQVLGIRKSSRDFGASFLSYIRSFLGLANDFIFLPKEAKTDH